MSRPAVPRRHVLAAALLAVGGPALARPCPPARVLFVCPAGTVKSPIAREALKHRAAARRMTVAVQSRGVHPEDHLTPQLAARLAADGIDPRAEPVQALTAADVAQADVVIAFDEAAKAPNLAGARVWDVPSWKGYDEAKAALDPKIEALLDELARRPCRN